MVDPGHSDKTGEQWVPDGNRRRRLQRFDRGGVFITLACIIRTVRRGVAVAQKACLSGPVGTIIHGALPAEDGRTPDFRELQVLACNRAPDRDARCAADIAIRVEELDDEARCRGCKWNRGVARYERSIGWVSASPTTTDTGSNVGSSGLM